MWEFERFTEYPVKVSGPDPRMAKLILTQFGGPNGELGASTRYITQHFAMTDPMAKSLLIDIGTEELAHLEILGNLFHQLIDGVPPMALKEALGDYYSDHGYDAFYVNASGAGFTVNYISAVGDVLANLEEDIAAEEKARAVYENLLDLTDDPCVGEALRFLWSRELIHSRRFQEAKFHVGEKLKEKRILVPGVKVERITADYNGRHQWNIGEMNR